MAKLSALKMDVNVESIERMVQDNEHNKYTMLYYLIRKRRDRGNIDIVSEIRLLDEKAKATFQSENEKTKEIKYKAAPLTGNNLNLKTLKHTDTVESDRFVSARKTTGAGGSVGTNPSNYQRITVGGGTAGNQAAGGPGVSNFATVSLRKSQQDPHKDTHLRESLTYGGFETTPEEQSFTGDDIGMQMLGLTGTAYRTGTAQGYASLHHRPGTGPSMLETYGRESNPSQPEPSVIGSRINPSTSKPESNKRIMQKKRSVEVDGIPKHKSSKSEGKPILSSTG